MIEIDKIIFKAGGKQILDNISLEVPENSFLVITGPNGSGKSTLAKIIMGILQPTSGRVLLDGEDITSKNITEHAQRGLSFAFQQPVKIKGVTVRDLLEIAISSKAKHSKATPESYLKLVGLEPNTYLDRELSSNLSGGELKRIEIASVLARDAKYLIFDEPEAGIDLWSFSDLTSVFRQVRKNHTIVIISHQERIIRLADEVIVLENGQIKRRDTPDKIIQELA